MRDENENTYVLDANAPTEVRRLEMQSIYLNELMHEPLAELRKNGHADLERFKDVLDIACGPGGWSRMIAHDLPNTSVVGIDISTQSIEYATMRAKTRQLDNVRFLQMNALKPLAFADASFDLLNIRLAFGFMPRDCWPALLKECFRVLRPGGVIRVTELERGHSEFASWETIMNLFSIAMKKTNKGHSATGSGIGLVSALRPLMTRAGFKAIRTTSYAWDVAYGERGHEVAVDDFKSGFGQMQAFIAEHTGTPIEGVNRQYQQALVEMQREDFSAISFLVTAWGKKQ